jgi:hypothetical protein
MEPRQIRGWEIAENCKIKRTGFQDIVPNHKGDLYSVA